MKNWEDIIKDKLEGYESVLPEGSLAEFRARREETGKTAAKKHSPLVWILPAAAAAGIAAVLLLRQPGVPEQNIQQSQQPTVAVAVSTEPSGETESSGEPETSAATAPVQVKPLVAHAVTPKVTGQSALSPEEEIILPTDTAQPEEAPAEQKPAGQAPAEQASTIDMTTGSSTPQIHFPEVTVADRGITSLNTATWGKMTGGGLLAAVLVSAVGKNYDNAEPAGATLILRAYAHGDSSYLYTGNPSYGTSPFSDEDSQPAEVVKGISHKPPLKTGLSIRVPLSQRISLTTGLDYSLYSSELSYYGPTDIRKTQHVHYIGIPVRLDLTLHSGRWLDLYVGGGIEGDYCVAATVAGNKIQKDKPSLSLIGTTGIQFNITDRLGLYLEPQLYWEVPFKGHNLQTYRTEKPANLCNVATGLRITL